MSRIEMRNAKDAGDEFQPCSTLAFLGRDAIRRIRTIRHYAISSIFLLLAFVHKAYASNAAPQTSPNSTDAAIWEDVYYLVNLFSWRDWSQRATDIRQKVSRDQCLANLNLVLSAVGPLANASTNGSSGALTLLPTAGALIGSPTKELWVVYKLMPLAGILSMLLSLGGNIVPTEATDYELNSSALSYGGMIATSNEDDEDETEAIRPPLSNAQAFAAEVDARSQDMKGGTKYVRVWYGVILQLFWLAVLLGACWFTQSGSILVWWCKVRSRCSCCSTKGDANDRHRIGLGCSSGMPWSHAHRCLRTLQACRSLVSGRCASPGPPKFELARTLLLSDCQDVFQLSHNLRPLGSRLSTREPMLQSNSTKRDPWLSNGLPRVARQRC